MPPEAQETRSHPRFVAITIVIVVGSVVAGAWWVVGRQSDEGLANPATVELPIPAADRSAAASYFAGPGARLLQFVHATRALPARRPTDACEAISVLMTAIGSPRQLAADTTAIPDAAIRSAAENHVDAVVGYVGSCRRDSAFEEAADRAHFTVTVFRRLLLRDGVT
jgi:hypothetical protein